MTREDCPLAAPCDELRETTKELADLRVEMRGVVTELRTITDINRRLDKQDSRLEAMEKLATQMSEVAKSAHKRLDSMEAGQRWLIGITITLVLGVVTLFTKFI